MERDIIYKNWLYHVPGIGRKKYRQLLEIAGGARQIYEMPHSELKDLHAAWKKEYGTSPITLRDLGKIEQQKAVVSPVRLWQLLKEKGIRVISEDDEGYPERLMDIPDRPAILYEIGEQDGLTTDSYVNYRGDAAQVCDASAGTCYVNIDCEAIYNENANNEVISDSNKHKRGNYVNKIKDKKYSIEENDIEDYVNDDIGGMNIITAYRPAIAVIGSRICSEYGRMVAGRIGRLCAQMGIELISGMAVGIDGIAQRAALEAGGKVTAVLGSGVDVCYPKENRELYETLLQKGRIISEYIPGTEPVAGNFPLRNRIISGLADAVIVVEAKERSGTMITVDMALEQGRQVYIIPGRLTDPLSAGCNRLISQGAEIIWNLGETLDMIRSTVLCKQYEIGGDQTEPYNTVGNKNDDPELCKSIEAPQNAKLCKQHESDILKTDASLYVVPPGLSYRQKTIWEALDFEPRTCQEIYERLMERSDIPFSTMQQELLEMELYGLIGQEGGRFFRKGV